MAEYVIDAENNIVEIIKIKIFFMIFILLKYKIKKILIVIKSLVSCNIY